VALGLRKDDRLLLSREDRFGAISLIVGADDASLVDRVLGPPASVATAARVIPRAVKQRLDQRIYENRKVAVPHKLAQGHRRLARKDDVPKLAEWLIAILAETESEGDGMSRGVAESAIARQVATGEIHVWDHDGEIVSSAAAVGPTRHAIRVNFVYTPPSLRRQGYATSLVASVTETLLRSGRQFVFLHTDLANPASNAIYQRIGYERVGEFSMVRFEPRGVSIV
jgi:predicted GNAT family acetyltransferase